MCSATAEFSGWPWCKCLICSYVWWLWFFWSVPQTPCHTHKGYSIHQEYWGTNLLNQS